MVTRKLPRGCESARIIITSASSSTGHPYFPIARETGGNVVQWKDRPVSRRSDLDFNVLIFPELIPIYEY